jgi:DNA primase
VNRTVEDGRRHRIDVAELKQKRPLADVVASSGVSVQRSGPGTFRALCPFHEERTPSFWIDARDPSDEHYWCFGCSARGDVIAFVMAREGCSFVDACERLDSGQQLAREREDLPKSKPSELRWEWMEPSSAERQVVRIAVEVYQQGLWRSSRAQAYLAERGVSEEVARTQRLGFADGHGLLARLRDTNEVWDARTPIDVARELGLVLPRPMDWGPGPPDHELLRDRVVIPELRGGEPVWFIGRSLDGAAKSKEGAAGRPRPKYLSLRGERPVLGLEHVEGQPSVYVMEGPFDWLAAVRWGLPAFAICGTHFPADRLPSLDSAVAIYGVFDPDRAGRSAAERFAPMIGTRWRPVRMPNGLDLAELAALGDRGREIFRVLVGRARSAAWQATERNAS